MASGGVRVNAARQAILDALSTVPGLHPTASMPDVATAGAAWPVWEQTTTTRGKLAHVFTRAYGVVVVLPADYLPETVDSAEGLDELVSMALLPVGPFDRITPAMVTFDDANAMPAIQVTGLIPAVC